MTSQVLLDNPVQARRRFLSAVSGMVGISNVRALYTPTLTEGLTVADGAVASRVWTHSATLSGRLARLGRGAVLGLDGATHYATCPDATDLSFGDGATDVPFSMVAVANVTDTVNVRTFFAKNNEYAFSLDNNDKLILQLVDASAAAVPSRLQDSATLRQGTFAMFGATYTKATGGATAANDISLYENGAVVASTATNAAGYVAMENTTNVPTLAALNGGASGWLPGQLALMLVVQAALTSTQHALLCGVARQIFGVPL